MAAKKKARKKTRHTPSKGEAKFKRPAKMERKPRSVTTGRFESMLTDELVDELCTVHREGDLIPGTALACGVHPDLLKAWLEKGSAVDAPDPFARLFATFAVIEAEIRREDFKKVRDPFTKNSAGIIWYLERRNPMLRKDAVPKAGQIFAVAELLEPKQDGALSKEAAIWIARQMARNMPPEIREIFTEEGWNKNQITEGSPDEQASEERDDGSAEDGDDDDWSDDEDDR